MDTQLPIGLTLTGGVKTTANLLSSDALVLFGK